jgi:hypothetical protein
MSSSFRPHATYIKNTNRQRNQPQNIARTMNQPQNSPTLPPTSPTSPLNSHGHIVVTGYDANGNLHLYIHVEGRDPNSYTCNIYNPNIENGRMMRTVRTNSPTILVAEHGWFKNVDTFDTICTKLKMKAPAIELHEEDHEGAFDLWRNEVLRQVEKGYGIMWQSYEGHVI